MFGRVDPRKAFGRQRADGRVLAHVHRRAHSALAVQEERERERQVPRAGTQYDIVLIRNLNIGTEVFCVREVGPVRESFSVKYVGSRKTS